MSNDFHPWMKKTKKLSVMIHFDAESPYLAFHEKKEDITAYLSHVFSEVFSTATGGEFLGVLRMDTNDFFIDFNVYHTVYDFFETDYKLFVDAIFGKIPLPVFGIARLAVVDMDKEISKAKQAGMQLGPDFNLALYICRTRPYSRWTT